MPIVHGTIEQSGSVIDVMVSVSLARRRLLGKRNLKAPAPVHVRVLVDTGASISGFSPRVFTELNIIPVSRISVYTPSTSPSSPHEANLYDVILAVVANGRANHFPAARVMEADCWLADEGLEALIGRDILDRCFFQYHGPERTFTLAF